MSEKPEVKVNLPGDSTDKAVSSLLTEVLGPAARETGALLGDVVGLIGDPIRAWRQVNRADVARKTKLALHRRGISEEDAREIPFREVVTIVNAISDIDEDSLQTMWAGLIATARDPDAPSGADRSFTGTLALLNEDDALLFSTYHMSKGLGSLINGYFYRTRPKVDTEAPGTPEVVKDYEEYVRAVQDKVSVWVAELHSNLDKIKNVHASVENLVRLGLVEYSAERERANRRNAMIMGHRHSLQDKVDDLTRRIAVFDTGTPQQIEICKKAPIERTPGMVPSFRIRSTAWGDRLAAACDIRVNPDAVEALS